VGSDLELDSSRTLPARAREFGARVARRIGPRC